MNTVEGEVWRSWKQGERGTVIAVEDDEDGAVISRCLVMPGGTTICGQHLTIPHAARRALADALAPDDELDEERGNGDAENN